MRGALSIRTISWVILLAAVFVSGCSKKGSPTSPSAVTDASPAATATAVGLMAQGIAIEGQYTMNVGDQLRVSAVVTMSDGSRTDVTADAAWTTDNAAIATASAGLITATGPGAALVTAAYESISARLAVTVRGGSGDGTGSGGGNGGGGGGTPTITRLEIEGTPRATVGGSTQLAAIASYSDGSRENVTGRAAWSVSPSRLASVGGGLLRGISPGDVTVSASLEGATATLPAQITSDATTPTVVGITVTGGGNVAVGGNTALSATATLSDGSQAAVTSLATWTSSNNGVATVAAGVVHGVSAGTATVSAQLEGFTASVDVQVTGGGGGGTSVVSVSVSGNPAVTVGATSQLTATATLANGTQQNVTGAATWISSNAGVASVSGGLVTGVAAGSATISAQYQGIGGQTTVQVGGGGGGTPTVVSVAVSGAGSVQAGQSTPLSATATLSDGTLQNVTALATWSSSAPAVATVSGGVVAGVAAGSANVSATYQGKTGQQAVQVTAAPAAVVGIVVTGNLNILVGGSTQITVLANMSDGSQVNVTAAASLTPNLPLLASVSANGVVTGLLPGLLGLTASYQGFTADVQLQINAALPVLGSLSITGDSSVKLLELLQLNAIAHMTDGTQVTVTSDATWSSGNLGILDLLGNGLLRGLLLGNVTVTAAYQGQTAQKTVQVTLF